MGKKTSRKRIKKLLLMKFLIFYLLVVRICYAAVICPVSVQVMYLPYVTSNRFKQFFMCIVLD